MTAEGCLPPANWSDPDQKQTNGLLGIFGSISTFSDIDNSDDSDNWTKKWIAIRRLYESCKRQQRVHT